MEVFAKCFAGLGYIFWKHLYKICLTKPVSEYYYTLNNSWERGYSPSPSAGQCRDAQFEKPYFVSQFKFFIQNLTQTQLKFIMLIIYVG
jgi:hypothetical protein